MKHRLVAVGLILVVLFPQAAAAYVGPGSGITVIGAALAFIGAILLAIVGFIWYPLKRAWRAISARSTSPDQPVKSGR